jgi:hypothetical protein
MSKVLEIYRVTDSSHRQVLIGNIGDIQHFAKHLFSMKKERFIKEGWNHYSLDEDEKYLFAFMDANYLEIESVIRITESEFNRWAT